VLAGDNYRFAYPGVEAYIESIKRSGFAGRKVMITWGLHPETREAFLAHGFEIVDVPWTSEPFFKARVRVAMEYLRDHHQEFRWVHWLDIKDLILQSDPSVWIDEHVWEHSIIGSTESVTISQESTNWLWATSILGEARANEIRDCVVLNGGSWSATAEAMSEIFNQVHPLCQAYGGPYPPCQISMAYVINTMFGKDFYTPHLSESYAFCGHPFWSPWRTPCFPYLRDAAPVLDVRTCTLYPGEGNSNPNNTRIEFNDVWGRNKPLKTLAGTAGQLRGVECIACAQNKPFSIVHGYDRAWNLKAMFESKYRFHGNWDWEAYKANPSNFASGERAEFKRLRSPLATPPAPQVMPVRSFKRR
jgi:hypothetical protein